VEDDYVNISNALHTYTHIYVKLLFVARQTPQEISRHLYNSQ